MKHFQLCVPKSLVDNKCGASKNLEAKIPGGIKIKKSGPQNIKSQRAIRAQWCRQNNLHELGPDIISIHPSLKILTMSTDALHSVTIDTP